jgi:hypothetical protein
MTNHEPPPWKADPLSKYFSEAEHNTRACSVNWPDVYAVQQRAHALLLRLADSFEYDTSGIHHFGAPRMLLLRSHSAILATMRNAMSGQTFEAQAVLRVAIEDAWYALHITRDPSPPARARVWWGRGDSPEATQACKDEFTVGNVRRTHEAVDPDTAGGLQRVYDDTISLGGHPNQAGVALGLRIDEHDDQTVTIGVGFLHPIPALMLTAIKAAVDVATGVAKIVSTIYPERFRIASLDEEVNMLIRHSAEAFGARARSLRHPTADSTRTRPV